MIDRLQQLIAVAEKHGRKVAIDGYSMKTNVEIAREIGADALIYQDLSDLKAALRAVNPAISNFEASCFDGQYITGDVTVEYLSSVESTRGGPARLFDEEGDGTQLDLNLVTAE